MQDLRRGAMPVIRIEEYAGRIVNSNKLEAILRRLQFLTSVAADTESIKLLAPIWLPERMQSSRRFRKSLGRMYQDATRPP